MKFFLSFIVLIPALLTAQTNGLSLAEVRAQVLSDNPSVRESLQRITAAEAVLKQARSAYLPTVSLSGSAGYMDVNAHPDSDISNRYNDGYKQASCGLQASWLLFDGFAREARSLSAKYGVQQSRELAENTRRLLVLSATVSFRQAQLASENIKIAERDLAFNTSLEADALKRFRAGVLPEADVHNFSIRALQAESSALEARLDYRIAGTVLAELMALPDAQLPPELQPVAVVVDELPAVPAVDGVLDYALRNRPDYKALQSGRLALEQQVRVAKGDLLPQIALVGDVNYTENDGRSTVQNYGNTDSFAGVAVKWDLFTGGHKINTIKEARAEMQALEERQEALRLSIRSALCQRIDQAETGRAVFERQKKIQELTILVRDSIQKSYTAGVAPITRLNEAQTDLVRASGGFFSSYISYLLSLNRLDIETGRVLNRGY